ncbi:hypothetical protein GQX74_004654 [Glossina fuscipes]|nr:hypothetical protein GQX74_004654 [Glossina fuscipes]
MGQCLFDENHHTRSVTADDGPFAVNAPIIQKIIEAIPRVNSKLSFLYVCTNPINSLVPLAAEVLRKLNRYDKLLLSETDGFRSGSKLAKFHLHYEKRLDCNNHPVSEASTRYYQRIQGLEERNAVGFWLP